VLGASFTTAFLQPFGVTQSIVRLGGAVEGSKWLLVGAKRWAGDAMQMENTLKWVQEKSDFMRLRPKSINRELHEVNAGKRAIYDAALQYFTIKMQLVADIPTWIGGYEKAISENPLDEDAAVAFADRIVRESQGSGMTSDTTQAQRVAPELTMFWSYFAGTLNLTIEQTAATNFKNPAAVAGWIGDMALLTVIPAILPSMLMFYLLKGGGADDEPEDVSARMARWQLAYLLGMVVGLRELGGAVEGYDYAGPPGGRIVTDITRASKAVEHAIEEGELDEKSILALAQLMGTAFGIPTTQLIRMYRGWKAWEDGEEGAGPQSILFGPPPKK
jgi:hypothetical protein